MNFIDSKTESTKSNVYEVQVPAKFFVIPALNPNTGDTVMNNYGARFLISESELIKDGCFIDVRFRDSDAGTSTKPKPKWYIRPFNKLTVPLTFIGDYSEEMLFQESLVWDYKIPIQVVHALQLYFCENYYNFKVDSSFKIKLKVQI